MDYTVKSGEAHRQRTDCAVVGVYDKDGLDPAARDLDAAIGGRIAKAVKDGDLRPKLGHHLMLHDTEGSSARRILVVGLGLRKDLDVKALRKAMRSAVSAVRGSGAKDAIVYLGTEDMEQEDAYRTGRALAEVAEGLAYRYRETKTSKAAPAPKLAKLALNVEKGLASDARKGLKHGRGIAAGVAQARELGNLPGNICTPSYLAKKAKELGRGDDRLTVKVLDEAEMKKLGMGSLLSVSKGSREPAKLIIMEFKNGRKGDAPHVLVGKGLTFDAGGISLKPAPAMDEMKFDMCGGASVFGAITALKELDLKINMVGIVPASENLPDGDANKPGDVVKSMSGQTIEILNTDAEGRLILCDALTYAKRYKPKSVVDIATLTGACVIALGNQASALYSRHDDLAEALDRAGQKSLDRAWRMPLWDEYQDQLKTNFADMANVGGKEAGSITAACFLARFTKGMKWAHLDVAGTAWNSGDKKGATGRPVPLLVEYLLDRA